MPHVGEPFTNTFAAVPNTHDLVSLACDTLFWSRRGTPSPWLVEGLARDLPRRIDAHDKITQAMEG